MLKAADKFEAAMQGIVGGVATQAKEILGEFISLAGAGDPIRFAAKRAVLQLILETRHFILHLHKENSNLNLIFGLETQERQKQ